MDCVFLDFVFSWCEQWKKYKIRKRIIRQNQTERVIDGNAMKRKDGNTMERNKNGWTDLLNGKRARFGRIFGMEIGDNVGSMSKFVGG